MLTIFAKKNEIKNKIKIKKMNPRDFCYTFPCDGRKLLKLLLM
jgi:hypothetical protein